MDNLTHSFVGVLIGQAGLKRRTGLAMPALVLGANLPDVDAACLFWLEGAEQLAVRRGITHGPIAWALLPLALAGLLWGWDRWQARRGTRPEARLPVRFGWLYLLSLAACLTHPALDWLNVYGIRLLEPFSSRWFYGDTLFIIDVWLWMLLGFATWFSLRREKRGGEWRLPAQISLAATLAYVGANGMRSQVGPDGPEGLARISSPVPLVPFAREDLAGTTNDWRYWHGSASSWIPLLEHEDRCRWPDVVRLRVAMPDLDAFLFWSRAPFAERAPDGSVLIRDARYYDPRARDRFTVALPDVRCEPIQ